MKSLIKKTAVLVFALVVIVSTASTVLAGGGGSIPWPGWDPPPGQGNKPNGPNSD